MWAFNRPALLNGNSAPISCSASNAPLTSAFGTLNSPHPFGVKYSVPVSEYETVLSPALLCSRPAASPSW